MLSSMRAAFCSEHPARPVAPPQASLDHFAVREWRGRRKFRKRSRRLMHAFQLAHSPAWAYARAENKPVFFLVAEERSSFRRGLILSRNRNFFKERKEERKKCESRGGSVGSAAQSHADLLTSVGHYMRSPAGALIGAGKSASVVDFWLRDSGVNEGKVFRRVLKNGARQDGGVTANGVWSAVKRCAKQASIANLAPHDLRRSYHEELCYCKSASVYENECASGFRLAPKCYPAAIAFFGRFSEAGARLLRLFIERHCRDRGIRLHLESSRGLLGTFLGGTNCALVVESRASRIGPTL